MCPSNVNIARSISVLRIDNTEFCDTDRWLCGYEAAYINCQTVLIFCFHFLGHKKKKSEKCFSFPGPVRILLSRTVIRSRRRGKAQGIENPAQESQCINNLIGLACSLRTRKILVSFVFSLWTNLQRPIFSQNGPHATSIHLFLGVSSLTPWSALFFNRNKRTSEVPHWGLKLLSSKKLFNDEMVYEMNHIWTADMKSSEAMIFAVMRAIFAIA